MADASSYIMTKLGDATAEVEAALREVGSADEAGLHRYFFVTRAGQTVVMAAGRDAPIALTLRRTGGWEQPEENV